MLKYKFDVGEALEKAGINMYMAKKTKILSQDTLKKIKNGDTSISLESINRVCMILNMQPEQLLLYEDNKEEKANLYKNFPEKNIT